MTSRLLSAFHSDGDHGVGRNVAAGCGPSDAMGGGILLKSNFADDCLETRGDLAGWRKTGTEDVHPHQDWQSSFTVLHEQLGGFLDDLDWDTWTLFFQRC